MGVSSGFSQLADLGCISGFSRGAVDYWKRRRLQPFSLQVYRDSSISSELCIFYDQAEDAKDLAFKSLGVRKLLGDLKLSNPGNFIAENYGVLLTTNLLGNTKISTTLLGIMISKSAHLDKIVIIPCGKSFADIQRWLQEILKALKSVNFEAEIIKQLGKSNAASIFETGVLICLNRSLNGLGVQIEDRLTGNSKFSDFVNDKLPASWRGLSVDEYLLRWSSLKCLNDFISDEPLFAELDAEMVPQPESNETVDWIQCDFCDKWRILDSKHTHFVDSPTFKCADISGVTCATPDDTIRFANTNK